MPSGAKKRKAAKNKKLSTTNLHQRENDGGEISSRNRLVEVETREDNSYEDKSKDANEIEIGSKSKSSNGSSSSSSNSSDDESHLESDPIESVRSIESLSEKISPIVDPVKKVDLAVDEDKVVVSEIDLKDDCLNSGVVVESVLKENMVEKLLSLDEKALLESKEYEACSMPAKDSTSDHKQAAADATPLAVQKTTSWKSCCGIFELFSGSER